MLSPRELILEIVQREDGFAFSLAMAIRQSEGWTLSPEDTATRIIQCLKGKGRRHFELDWYMFVVDACVDRGIREPLTAMIDERRRDREHFHRRRLDEMSDYELRKEAHAMHKARPLSRNTRRTG